MSQTFEECLQTFIKHVEELNKEDESGCNGYLREFVRIREIQKSNKDSGHFQAEAGKKSVNIKKNRFKDIIPFDASRVVLSTLDGVEDSDYINASFIKNIDGKRGYIAAQGPLPNTVDDFWRMLWEYNTEIVFMACLVQEDGKRKCEKYWPDLGKSHKFGNITVKLESEKEIAQDFIKRELTAESNGQVHHLIQFQYKGWADHGIPRTPAEIRKIIGKMRETRLKEDIPVVIHCSAGCGRTGTICAVDYVWNLLLYRRLSEGFSLFDIIKTIREQRQSMVQTPDQYELVHLVVRELCEEMMNDSDEAEYVNAHFEEVYTNADVIDNPDLTEDLYQDIGISSADTTKQKPVIMAEKPIIKRKPEIVERQTITKDDSKSLVSTSGQNAPTKHSYENVAPKVNGAGFKTVIKNVNTTRAEIVKNKPHPVETQKNKMSDSQPAGAMATKTDHSQTGTTKHVPNGATASQSAAFIGDNVYSKVEQNKVQQTPPGGSTAVAEEEYAPVDFKMKDEPVCVESQMGSNSGPQHSFLYENHILPSTSYENYNLPAAESKTSIPASRPVITPEDDAPVLPDRRYDPQEIHPAHSKPNAKNLAPPPPATGHSGVQVLNLAAAKGQGHSGVQVMNPASTKGQGPPGVQVMNPTAARGQGHSGVQVMNPAAASGQGHSGVQVMNPAGPRGQGNPGVQVINSAPAKSGQQTKGTDGVRIKCDGGRQPQTWGFHGPRIVEQSWLAPNIGVQHAGGSVRSRRSMKSAGPQHVAYNINQYNNVQMQHGSGGQTVPPKKGIVQQLLGGTRDRYVSKGTHGIGYENTEIGFPSRVGHPRGSRPLPQSWINPR
ncbi:uncharacterized protein LOC121367569 [Gigantopelta aegis]|uniref:uncharacterized protein LOC121367569 n=1 Tax=Gigantopelta aegis TaxID=1735272 RepID=UPI001B88E2AC|nr:uncharacterized protein LOC121367569 [Gigantopelta aegis]